MLLLFTSDDEPKVGKGCDIDEMVLAVADITLGSRQTVLGAVATKAMVSSKILRPFLKCSDFLCYGQRLTKSSLLQFVKSENGRNCLVFRNNCYQPK